MTKNKFDRETKIASNVCHIENQECFVHRKDYKN